MTNRKQQKSKSAPPKEKEIVHLNHNKTGNESPKENENKQTIQESPWKKPFVSHYDPIVFYLPLYEAANKPAKPVYGSTKIPIKLTVTLKDIGFDSPIPGKAAEMRQQEKNGKWNKPVKWITKPSSQSPLSHSSRRIRFDLADENITPTNDQDASPCSSPNPKNLLSSAHKISDSCRAKNKSEEIKQAIQLYFI